MAKKAKKAAKKKAAKNVTACRAGVTLGHPLLLSDHFRTTRLSDLLHHRATGTQVTRAETPRQAIGPGG
jgi:hypothetical protein